MVDKAKEDFIRITHYINPHMFWFKYESSFFGKSKFCTLEDKIQKYYNEHNDALSSRKFEPQIGDTVGVINFSWNRWVRAKVDYIVEGISTPPKYILWALDYGVPLETNIRWIRPLPKEFAEEQNDNVYFGGLSNIVPAEKSFDFIELCAKVVECDSWSPKAVKMIEELISDAASIKFIKDAKEMDGQVFGNLEITTHTNKVIKADIVLLETNHAKATNNFLKAIKDLGTNRVPRWQTNEGNTLVFKYHTNKIDSMNVHHNTRSSSEKVLDAQRSEYDIEINKKVTDWEERNKQCQLNEVTVDDISFNDSASALSQKISKKESKSIDEKNNENEGPAFLVAGTSRLKRLERYKKHVPKPPKTDDPITSLIKEKESINLKEGSQEEENKSLSLASSQSNNTQSRDKAKSETGKEVNASDGKSVVGSDTRSAVGSGNSRAANARVAKLMNKRKSLQVKAAFLNQMPDTVIPAGYDLRNLQPTKAPKANTETAEASNGPSLKDTQAMKSAEKLIEDSESTSKNMNNRKPLAEVDEVW